MNPDRAAAVARLAEVIGAVERRHPVRVAVDGVDGSGATTLADDLARAVRTRGRPCLRISLDAFPRGGAAAPRRTRDRGEPPHEERFDFEALRSLVLEPLGPDGDRRYRTAIGDPLRERAAEQGSREAPRDAVVVVDGCFLQRGPLLGCWDVRVWVETDLEVARARAVARDRGTFGPEVDRRYRERVDPAHRRYLERADPVGAADARFVNNDPDHPVLVLRS